MNDFIEEFLKAAALDAVQAGRAKWVILMPTSEWELNWIYCIPLEPDPTFKPIFTTDSVKRAMFRLGQIYTNWANLSYEA